MADDDDQQAEAARRATHHGVRTLKKLARELDGLPLSYEQVKRLRAAAVEVNRVLDDAGGGWG